MPYWRWMTPPSATWSPWRRDGGRGAGGGGGVGKERVGDGGWDGDDMSEG